MEYRLPIHDYALVHPLIDPTTTCSFIFYMLSTHFIKLSVLSLFLMYHGNTTKPQMASVRFQRHKSMVPIIPEGLSTTGNIYQYVSQVFYASEILVFIIVKWKV